MTKVTNKTEDLTKSQSNHLFTIIRRKTLFPSFKRPFHNVAVQPSLTKLTNKTEDLSSVSIIPLLFIHLIILKTSYTNTIMQAQFQTKVMSKRKSIRFLRAQATLKKQREEADVIVISTTTSATATTSLTTSPSDTAAHNNDNEREWEDEIDDAPSASAEDHLRALLVEAGLFQDLIKYDPLKKGKVKAAKSVVRNLAKLLEHLGLSKCSGEAEVIESMRALRPHQVNSYVDYLRDNLNRSPSTVMANYYYYYYYYYYY